MREGKRGRERKGRREGKGGREKGRVRERGGREVYKLSLKFLVQTLTNVGNPGIGEG